MMRWLLLRSPKGEMQRRPQVANVVASVHYRPEVETQRRPQVFKKPVAASKWYVRSNTTGF